MIVLSMLEWIPDVLNQKEAWKVFFFVQTTNNCDPHFSG